MNLKKNAESAYADIYIYTLESAHEHSASWEHKRRIVGNLFSLVSNDLLRSTHQVYQRDDYRKIIRGKEREKKETRIIRHASSAKNPLDGVFFP